MDERIIDNKWFPVANRAGFHIERPDSHYFLEQYIPFDLSNTNKNEKNSQILQKMQGVGIGDLLQIIGKYIIQVTMITESKVIVEDILEEFCQ